MEYLPTEMKTQVIRDVIDILDRMDDSRGPATELETTIAQARQGSLNGPIVFALQQLECLCGISKSELTGCFDTSPAIPFEDRKTQIKNALSELLKGNVIDFSFLEHRINRFRRHGRLRCFLVRDQTLRCRQSQNADRQSGWRKCPRDLCGIPFRNILSDVCWGLGPER